MSNDRHLTDDELGDQLRRFLQDVYSPVDSGDEMWQKLASQLDAASALGTSTVMTPESPARAAATPRTPIWPAGMSQRLGSAVAVLVTGIIIVVSVALFQRHSPVSRQSVRPTATSVVGCPPAAIRAELPPNISLNAVALTSPTSGWAVGWIYSPTDGTPQRSVILQFKDCHWSSAGLALPGIRLTSISMTLPDDGWIIGSNADATSSVLLHLVAGHWQLVAISVLQAANAYFESLSMLSATEGWIIAYLAKSATGQPNPILLHLHNGFWSAVTMPFAGPDAILAMSPDDAWVASSTEPAGATGLFFHYDQGKWTSVLLPPGMNILYLHRNGPDDAWATGVVTSSSTTGYGQSPALLHFNGTSWSSDSLDGLQNPAQELQMLSADEGWAVGTTGGPPGYSRVALLQHYVAGTWQAVALPSAPLADITSFTCESPDDCWALGESPTVVFVYVTYSLLHYYDGGWTIY
jgi:hypothetical protein